MPFQEVSRMASRQEFVLLATQEGVNVRQLCRRFGVSPKTGYKWLARFRAAGAAGLSDQSRRPKRSPARTEASVEQMVLEARAEHPAWGGRKLRRLLQQRGAIEIPAASTITEILRRHHLLDAAESQRHRAFTRFEHAAPNDLWQMDFKGHFALEAGGRCHPLTVLDDHSRYALGVQACDNEQGLTVQRELTGIFRCFGLPRRMLMDNGAPWGSDREHPFTPLTVWLMRLGIRVSHGRPYHPQTQGKDERFHRTLQCEVLQRHRFRDLAECQARFNPWRETYNSVRPHEALGLCVPASRYQLSATPFPETLPPIEYPPGYEVRKVQDGGEVSFHGRTFRVAQAFRGYPVGLRPTPHDSCFEVCFCHTELGSLNLRASNGEEFTRLTRQAASRAQPPLAALAPAEPASPEHHH